MITENLMRHQRFDTPAYSFWVNTKPYTKGKGKNAYMSAVTEAAEVHISAPITENDIEVEILYSTLTKKGIRADIDNVIKPTLDALKGVAYKDDMQVRSVTGTIFDRNKDNLISGRVEHMGRLFYSPDKDILLISIYSDSRIQELGGEDAVKRMQLKSWDEEFRSQLNKLKK